MAKTKILVIDDENDIVDTVSFMLRSRGYDVITATDGGEGMTKAMLEHPDLVLLDIIMPVMDGFEVCLKLKKDKQTSRLPIIMFTARGDNEAVVKAKNVGADDYIVKPFNLPTLVTKINKLITKPTG
jgi:two-component system alkaline phosphatase synthesis response regulator PhoP